MCVLTLAELKTSRPDGILRGRLHPYRKLMPFIMRTRNESVVYFDTYVRAEALLDYLDRAKKSFDINITHLLVASLNYTFAANPAMNQFISGRRIYQRKTRQITFSMKRKKLNKKAKLAVVKMEMKDGETMRELTERINGKINVERSGKKTYADKEYALFNLLPRPALQIAAWFLRTLDFYNLLPYSFMKTDGMYTSCVIANLGSVGMDPGFHHLYEWGNAPLFMMVGKIEDKAIVENGQVVPAKILHVRWSYDERIDDGLTARYGINGVVEALEDPDRFFGCVKEDGSDTHPLWPLEEAPSSPPA